MDITEFMNQFVLGLANQLKGSSLYLTIFATLLGAVSGVFLSLTISILFGFFKKLSFNSSARAQLSHIAEENLLKCKSNIGILQNELDKLGTTKRFTLNCLSSLTDYHFLILHSPASFRSVELFLLRTQITALNSHHAQLISMVEQRARLDIEMRKAPSGQQENELIGLRLEYDQYLKGKFEDITQFTRILNTYLDTSWLKRLYANSIPVYFFKKKNEEVERIKPTVQSFTDKIIEHHPPTPKS